MIIYLVCWCVFRDFQRFFLWLFVKIFIYNIEYSQLELNQFIIVKHYVSCFSTYQLQMTNNLIDFLTTILWISYKKYSGGFVKTIFEIIKKGDLEMRQQYYVLWFDSRNFVLWRHLFINSLLLLRMFLSFDVNIKVFSRMQSLHVFVSGL